MGGMKKQTMKKGLLSVCSMIWFLYGLFTALNTHPPLVPRTTLPRLTLFSYHVRKCLTSQFVNVRHFSSMIPIGAPNSSMILVASLPN